YEAMIAGVGEAYPGNFISSDWFIFIDKQGLMRWSKEKTRSRIDGLKADITSAMKGTAILTGIDNLRADLDRRSFFSGVPLLLLLVVMVITVLYYVSMLVSYLARSREDDVALFRSRGVTTWQLARLYILEGLALALAPSVIAPFLAMGAVAAAGKLGYFSEITNGAMLPVALHWMPFAVSAVTGLLGLTMYVVPALVGARTGLVTHKMQLSRPPSVPFFQRLYLDIGLLVVGGLTFWELHSRGQVVSGGLFSDVQVNEALIFAPVLALTVVALLFTRFFPLFVRFFSGDSPALVHLLAVASLTTLGLTTATQALRVDISVEWVWEVALIGIVAAFYYWTNRTERNWNRTAGLAAQGGLIALLIYVYAPASDDILYVPTIVVALLVPFQVLFITLRRLNRTYPVWASMAIWRLARNPLQYSWLVLLLVMVTALGILATTVGGTLDRSYEERILYEVGSDLRVTGTRRSVTVFNESLTNMYLEIPGVTSISRALREDGNVGPIYSGDSFSILAIETDKFSDIAWYRDDFSRQPLTEVMGSLQSGVRADAIDIPEGAQTLNVWVETEEYYPNMFIRMIVQDNQGTLDTLSLGRIETPGWTLMEADIPQNLEWPLTLVSMQLYQPVFGAPGTPGTILLDDLHVQFDDGQEPQVLDDFEGNNKWIPVATSMISSDAVGVTNQAQHNGRQAGVFSFGTATDQGNRDFYRGPSGGPRSQHRVQRGHGRKARPLGHLARC
ncbi:MAG: ABC transporter permease, partial [Chloroflexi bacterium]|nr:ABC transporter permease [Chloroflexota bacterium]